MLFEELSDRYGPYEAEMIRQALTLEEFERYEIEELVPYFELKAERLYEEYRSRLNVAPPADGPLTTQGAYLDVLRRRWQEAEDMAHHVLKAEKTASEKELRKLGT